MKKQRGARLGQHFLKNKTYARQLARAICVSHGDTVLEIGPGKGALTKELMATGARVVAIEKDEGLARHLKETLKEALDAGQLEIIEGDVRDLDPRAHGITDYALAANIPYYITGEIIRQFLTSPTQPSSMALLIQKEVAERIVSSKESILSLSVKAYGEPTIIARVNRKHFSPPPTVDSAILLVQNISKRFFSDLSEEVFFEVVRTGFSSKRKQLANNLGKLFGKELTPSILASCSISAKARAENVALEQWKCLAKQARHDARLDEPFSAE